MDADAPLNLTNSGTILAAAAASATTQAGYADAEVYYTYGVYADDTNASVNNSGAIMALSSATATSATGAAYAEADDTEGLYVYYAGDVTNSGTISAASTATATGATGAEAYAGYEDGTYGVDLYYGGSLVNSGTISAATSVTAVANAGSGEMEGYSAYAYADDTYGIYVDDPGIVTNSGTISASSKAFAYTEAGGAWAESSDVVGAYLWAGDVNNSGTISAVNTATAISATGGANAYIGYEDGGTVGIWLDDVGTITNSGTVSAVSTATANGSTFARADIYETAGIYADSGTVFNNSGTVTASSVAAATATDPAGYAGADAETAGFIDYVPVTITNSGSITANSQATSSAKYSQAFAAAAGVYLGEGGNTITNSGTIAATASAAGDTATDTNSDYYHEAYAAGIVSDYYEYYETKGQLTGAAGLPIPPILGGNNTLVNTGTITATASLTGNATLPADSTTSAYYKLGAVGVALGPNSSITNSGTISATATLTGTATVDPTATGTANYGGAFYEDSEVSFPMAVGVFQNDYSYLNNSGVITATASVNGAQTAFDSIGVWMGWGSTIMNSGTITSGIGVVTDGDSAITNSGTITGTNALSSGPGVWAGMPTAIYLSGGKNTVALMTGSKVNGAIDGLSYGMDVVTAPAVGAPAPIINHLVLNSTNESNPIVLGEVGPAMDSINADQLLGFNTLDKTGPGNWIITREVLGTGLNISEGINITDGALGFGGNVTTPLYTQAAAGYTGFVLTPTTSGRIFTDSATLNNGGVGVAPLKGYYAKNLDYGTVFTSTAPITSGFNMTDVTSSSLYLIPTITHPTENTYNLSLLRDFTTTATTANQSAVARAFDIAYDWAGMDAESRDIMNMLVTSGEPINYDALAGFIHAAALPATFGAINQNLGTLSARMGGFISGGPQSMAMGAFLGPMLAQNADATMNDSNKNLLSATRNAPDRSQWGFWARAYGDWAKRDGGEVNEKYKWDIAGIAVGFDKKISSSLLAGASFGYSYTKAEMRDLDEDAKIDSYQGSLYGVYSDGPWYVDGIASYGYNKYDTTRTISILNLVANADGSYHSNAFTGYVETGYRVKVDKTLDIIPMASLQYSDISRQSFDESGAGIASLFVDSESANSFLGTLGVRVRKEFATATGGTVTPEFRARWVHEFSNSDYKVNASFGGSPGVFSVATDRPDRDSILLGLGLNASLRSNTSIFANFDANLGSEQKDYSGSLGIRYRW